MLNNKQDFFCQFTIYKSPVLFIIIIYKNPYIRPDIVAIIITSKTYIKVFFVPITPRITKILGNDKEGPANSNASAGPFPIPADMRPCNIGTSVNVAKYINENSKAKVVHCIEPEKIKGQYDDVSGPILISVDIFKDNLLPGLNDKYDLDVIICDDGLQHYNLARDYEIAVVMGNENLVMAGVCQQGHYASLFLV